MCSRNTGCFRNCFRKIVRHSGLFVWVLSESWRHLRALLLEVSTIFIVDLACILIKFGEEENTLLLPSPLKRQHKVVIHAETCRPAEPQCRLLSFILHTKSCYHSRKQNIANSDMKTPKDQHMKKTGMVLKTEYITATNAAARIRMKENSGTHWLGEPGWP